MQQPRPRRKCQAIELTGRHRVRGYHIIHLACTLRLNFRQMRQQLEG